MQRLAQDGSKASGISIRRGTGKSRYNHHAHDSGEKWSNGAELVDLRLSETRNKAIAKRVAAEVHGKFVSLRTKFHKNVQLT
jgi:hypothetical protein